MAGERYDLVIVGAGPAGSIAGFHAARFGLRVLIMDKAELPRRKPCAGGLTTKALMRIPFSIAEILESTTDTIKLSHRSQKPLTLTADGLVCGFIQRDHLDPLLLDAAKSEGCEFRKIGKITDIRCSADRVTVAVDDVHVQADHLIAADGANSRVRRLLKPKLNFSRGFAIEGIVWSSWLSRLPTMEFSFGHVDHGYGWLFPKRHHVNIGLYTCSENGTLSKMRLVEFARTKLGTDQVDDICGYPLGFGGRSYEPKHPLVIFAGDAAGMAEMFLGEGLHNAIKSGELAAKAVCAAACGNAHASAKYDTMIADIKRDLRMSEFLALKFFYPRLDSIGFLAFRLPHLQNALMRGFAAGRTLPMIAGDVLRGRIHPPVFPTRQ